MKNFVQDIFEKKFYQKLYHRSGTFKKVFKYLDNLENKNPCIVETGTCREEDNFAGDGMSTLMFDEYINYIGGSFTSIDINEENINFAKSKVSEKSNLICGDSVFNLYNISKDEGFPMIDVLYLDSFDIDMKNTHPSSFHHIKELLAIQSKIKKGALIIVDDSISGTGKGQYINEYMKDIGKECFFNEYQIAWIND